MQAVAPELCFSPIMRSHDIESLLIRVKRRLAASARPEPDRLDVSTGYAMWARHYADETAASFLDNTLARDMLMGLPQRRLLDAGCGVGRRIAQIPGAIGIDRSAEMLAAGGNQNTIQGDVCAMPFAANIFDMVWCRLVLGHLLETRSAYRELARVCAPGGYVFVTDFHPDAVAAGHQRTFTDDAGKVHAIEHYVHRTHIEVARDAGLMLVERKDAVIDESIRHFYEGGIGIRAYQRDAGLKLVAGFLFRKAYL
jgi:malonyl-CoA O-methyltransferase